MKIVAYYRVSTTRQGKSGLGLEAQRQTVAEHAKRAGQVVAEFTEVVPAATPIGSRGRPGAVRRRWGLLDEIAVFASSSEKRARFFHSIAPQLGQCASAKSAT